MVCLLKAGGWGEAVVVPKVLQFQASQIFGSDDFAETQRSSPRFIIKVRPFLFWIPAIGRHCGQYAYQRVDECVSEKFSTRTA